MRHCSVPSSLGPNPHAAHFGKKCTFLCKMLNFAHAEQIKRAAKHLSLLSLKPFTHEAHGRTVAAADAFSAPS